MRTQHIITFQTSAVTNLKAHLQLVQNGTSTPTSTPTPTFVTITDTTPEQQELILNEVCAIICGDHIVIPFDCIQEVIDVLDD